MPKLIGLVGAHRVGKTYLRDQLVQVTGGRKIDFSISRSQRAIGYHSGNQGYKPHERIRIQDHLLVDMDRSIDISTKISGVAPAAMRYCPPDLYMDRTPIDLIGYAILNLERHWLNDDQRAWLNKYIDDCIDSANRHFDKLILIQPGVKFQSDDKSGPIEDVEPLNSIYQAMFLRPDLQVDRMIMPEETVNIIQRIQTVRGFVDA